MASIEKVKLVHAVLNDTRLHIIANLSEKSNNISGLLEVPLIKVVDRSTLCYHLSILEEAGLLKSKYVILDAPHSKGRAGRFYELNRAQLNEAFKILDEMKQQVSPQYREKEREKEEDLSPQ